jgi:hypothetical protein
LWIRWSTGNSVEASGEDANVHFTEALGQFEIDKILADGDGMFLRPEGREDSAQVFDV